MSKDLPSIPDSVQPELRRSLVRLREEVQRLIGTRGNDPAARVQALNAGLIAVAGATGTGTGGPTDDPDLTPPPSPTFTDGDVAAGISQVIVTWSGIGYTQGSGNKQTIVYAVKKDPSDATLPTFPGDAGIVAIAPHAMNMVAIPSEPNTRWHVWLKFESVDGVQSTSPAGGTNGVQATTGEDVAALLEILTGEIMQSQLAATLSTRIDLIDAADTVAGSVAARVKAEAEARDAADELLADQIALESGIRDLADVALAGSVAAEASARGSANATISSALDTINAAAAAIGASVQQEVVQRSDADTAFAAQVMSLAASTGQGIAAIVTEQQVRSAADTNMASQVTSLIATFSTGTGDPVNAAALLTEQIARADADSAQAGQITSLAAAAAQDAASLQVEQLVRADQDGALAQSVLTVAAEANNNRSAIVVEQDARATADAATASQLSSLSATSATSAAAIQSEQDVRATADVAQASSTASLAAQVGIGDAAAAAAIVTEQSVRATADSTQASTLTTMTASVGSNLAGLQVEQDVRATADAVQASAVTSLSASMGNGMAIIQAEQEVRAAADAIQASQSTGLAAGLGGNTAALAAEQLVRATESAALGQTASSLVVSSGANTAAVLSEQQARTTENSAAASAAASMSASTANAVSAIQTEQAVRSAGDQAAASSTDALAATTANMVAGLVTEQTARATLEAATAQAVASLAASASNTQAAIRNEQDVRADSVEAVALNVTTLQARMDSVGGGASLEVRASAVDSAITGLQAEYTVKLDVNGYVSGYGIYGAAGGSEFIANVGRFAVTSPDAAIPLWAAGETVGESSMRRLAGTPGKVLVCKSGGTTAGVAPSMAGAIGSKVIDGDVTWQIASRVPFAVLTVPSTINGQTMPAGAYFDAAYIINGTIQNSQLANGAVDDLKVANLSAAKLTAGSGVIGGPLKSANYDPGNAGWLLQPDGVAQLPAASIIGLLTAAQINGNGLSIATSGGVPILTAGSTPAASTFSGNVTGQVAGTSAATLLSTANTASTNAASALTLLTDIASDSKLTPLEKQDIRREWDSVYGEKAGINAQAAALGITTENADYNSALTSLGVYLNAGSAYTVGATPPSWITDANLGTTTSITGSTFRLYWAAFYDARQMLLNQIAAVAATRATASGISGSLGINNLVANSSFEVVVSGGQRPAGWAEYAVNIPTAPWFRVTGRTGSGYAFALKAAGAYSGSTWGFGLLASDDTSPVASGRVRGGWIAGKTYMVAFYAKKVNGAGMGAMFLNWNTAPVATDSLSNPALTAGWQRYIFKITWGSSVEGGGGLYITVQNPANVVANDELHIDDLLIVEGEFLPEWSDGFGGDPNATYGVAPARQLLAGEAGLAVGSLTWDSSGNRTGGYGLGLTAKGLAAYNASGVATFALDGTTGNATFSGELSAATGTFSGALVAATGTFSGTLTASAINAVNTLNIADGAVTIPVAGTFTGVTRSLQTSVTSRTSSCTIGTIATAANGQGRVLLLITPTGVPQDPNTNNFYYLSRMAVTGVGDTTRYTWTIKRNGTVIRTKTIDYSTGSGTPTLIDMPAFVIDTPGPGVTCTYTYETSTTQLYSTPTNMDHEILNGSFLLLEIKK